MLSSKVVGQNLVPNFSFEDRLGCPETISNWSMLEGWFSPNLHSPDYFSECCLGGTSFSADVPSNFFGYQHPANGSAYIGLGTALFSNTREYLSIEMMDSLVSGIEYFVQFFVSRSDSSYYCSDDIGIAFTNNSVFENTFGSLSITPQISSTDAVYLMDTNNWISIKGSFIAGGGERFLTIGNFSDDVNTDTLSMISSGEMTNPNYMGAYYYIDAVCVSQDSLECSNVANIALMSTDIIRMYPNPAKDIVSVESSDYLGNGKVVVLDALGRTVLTSDFSGTKINVNIDDLNPGLYSVVFYAEETTWTHRMIKE